MIASETLIQVMLDNRELVASKKVFPRETAVGAFPFIRTYRIYRPWRS